MSVAGVGEESELQRAGIKSQSENQEEAGRHGQSPSAANGGSVLCVDSYTMTAMKFSGTAWH